jgi:probable F420-dependent oxidoreductase
MKVDGRIQGLAQAGKAAVAHEACGYDGVWTIDTSGDPFLPLALAAETTNRVDLGTGIAVALAHNPMTLAQTAWGLQSLSGGRFVLGLGSQIKDHVTRRFSMPWSKPVARMREMILAIRAIWESWDDGTKLDFQGDFYTHTLMTPLFDPGPTGHGAPRVFLAGVGERMTEVAGEVADGLVCHAFTTGRYVREVTLPAVGRGRAKAGKSLDGFELSGPMFIVSGRDETEMAAASTAVRQQIALYGSVAAYRPVLELHGWGDLQDELSRLFEQGRWQEMGDLVDDEMLDAFAVVGSIDAVARQLRERWGGLLHRVHFNVPFDVEPDELTRLVASIKGE